jgi:very-short-patch-repair endonuclease
MGYLEPIDFARYLRQTATSAEELFWQLMRNRQRCRTKFRRQPPLGIYTADFYCAEAKLVLEIDGSPHSTIEGKRRDEARDEWMQSQGIEVLGFGGWQVELETGQVVERIDEMLRQRCEK